MFCMLQKVDQELEEKKKKEGLQRGDTRERRTESNGVRERGRHRGITKQKAEEK